MEQLTIQDIVPGYQWTYGCSECCMKCLYWWEGRCPHGRCYDDFMAKHYPRERITGEHWTGWSRCEEPGEQDHWCRSGRYLNMDVKKICPEFALYEGQEIKRCLYANVAVFQDGFISCSICDTAGCEYCYKQFEEEQEK